MVATQPSVIYEKGKLYELSPNDLQADPAQPRKVIDAVGLEDITASVAKLGVLQPILFGLMLKGI